MEIMEPEMSKAIRVCDEKFDAWSVISCLGTYVAGYGLFNQPTNPHPQHPLHLTEKSVKLRFHPVILHVDDLLLLLLLPVLVLNNVS